MDVPPTILALLGAQYDSKWFGRDVLHLAPDSGRALMGHNNEIALMAKHGDETLLAVLGLKESRSMLRYDAATKQQIPVATPTTAQQSLLDDAIAYFAGADKLYRANRYRFDRRRSWGEKKEKRRSAPSFLFSFFSRLRYASHERRRVDVLSRDRDERDVEHFSSVARGGMSAAGAPRPECPRCPPRWLLAE